MNNVYTSLYKRGNKKQPEVGFFSMSINTHPLIRDSVSLKQLRCYPEQMKASRKDINSTGNKRA